MNTFPFPLFHALWQERNSFPNHESTSKLRLASGLKRAGDKDEKGKGCTFLPVSVDFKIKLAYLGLLERRF